MSALTVPHAPLPLECRLRQRPRTPAPTIDEARMTAQIPHRHGDAARPQPSWTPEDPTPSTSTRVRNRKIRHAVLAAVVTLAALPVAYLATAAHRLNNQVEHLGGVFSDTAGTRPSAAPAAAEAINILMLGTDRRSDVPTTGTAAETEDWEAGEQRSDSMMIVHIDRDRDGVSVVSIPRDSWVRIPDHGRAKINAAFSYGGAALAVRTVENLTGVRIDHVAVVDWAGFMAVTDALGGVDMTIPETTHDSARDRTWTAGEHHLNGDDALAYVGQRYGLPGGDLDRVRRQQAFFRALAQTALKSETAKDPVKIYDLLDIITENLAIDEEWSTKEMADLALSLRNVSAGDVRYLTVPVTGTGRAGSQSVVWLDKPAGTELWDAVRNDEVEGWATRHPDLLTEGVVN